jgi:putative intracellular protease/amidase
MFVSGYLLIVIQEGFDDMSLLACQVILEENENDVIISSISEGIVKGEDSSVLAVSFEEAIKQNIDYSGIVIIGGNEEINIADLNETISRFHKDGKIIAGIGKGIKIINQELTVKVSDSKEIMIDSNVITLLDPEIVEEFAEKLSSLIL